MEMMGSIKHQKSRKHARDGSVMVLRYHATTFGNGNQESSRLLQQKIWPLHQRQRWRCGRSTPASTAVNCGIVAGQSRPYQISWQDEPSQNSDEVASTAATRLKGAISQRHPNIYVERGMMNITKPSPFPTFHHLHLLETDSSTTV